MGVTFSVRILQVQSKRAFDVHLSVPDESQRLLQGPLGIWEAVSFTSELKARLVTGVRGDAEVKRAREVTFELSLETLHMALNEAGQVGGQRDAFPWGLYVFKDMLDFRSDRMHNGNLRRASANLHSNP